jgi:hypothetical protein
MKRLLLMMLMFCLSGSIFAQDASSAWRDVIKKCAKTDLIGKQSLFFGVSNLIGPGSIWRRADDKSIRLVSVLSDAFPTATDQALIVKANNTAGCVGDSTSRWNLRFGLPISTGATPISLNIGAILGGAHKVTVSVKGFALDTLDEDQWKKAFSTLGTDNVFFKDSQQPNRLLAENAVKVTGLTAVFDFSHDLSADVQAQYKGKAFTLGNSSSGSTKSGSNSSSGSTTASGGSAANTSTPSTNSSSTNSSNSGSATAGACASSSPSGSAPTGTNSTATNTSTSGSNSGSGSATLHIDVSGSRQITICVDGPFYILAAYSSLTNGTPIGIAPTQASIVLTDATLPEHAVAATDRPAPNQ